MSENGIDETGGYTLQLQSIPPTMAEPLAFGGTGSGILSPSIDTDFFSFVGAGGSVVRFGGNNGGGPLDLEIELVDAFGTPVPPGPATCDGGCCGGVTCGASVDATLPATGIYYLLVSDLGGDEGGTYTVTLDCIQGSCSSVPMASVTHRIAGSNVDSYSATAPLWGGLVDATVDLSLSGHAVAIIRWSTSPLQLVLPDTRALLIAPPTGSIGVELGPIANFSISIPADPALIGIDIYTQAAHLFNLPTVVLSNSQDWTIGF